MPDRNVPPPAADAADRLVDDMGLFLRGGPVPQTRYEAAGVPGDGTMSFDDAGATADPGAWTPSPAGRDTTPDREIGPYRVIRFVAHGGMGDVFHARHRVLPREVALKTIRARLADDPSVLARFLVEAKAVEKLKHPNVVKLYEFDEQAAEPYIAMEWVPGGDLSKRLPPEGLPPRDAAKLVRTLADAMSYAHDRGVLHRDLKPQNVLLTADGTPKIGDFGLARLRTADESRGLTQTGAIMGTPPYMAPEQATGADADYRTDVYALGAILFELLTGEPPFGGASKEAVLKQVCESDPPPPSSLTDGVPADLEVICLRCLSKHPEDRYQTAADLVADLDRFLAGEPLPRSPWRRLRRTTRAVRKRWRWAAGVAAVAGACAATALVMASLDRPPDGESATARRALENDLRAGRLVELVGAKGWPKWFRWRSGSAAGRRVSLGSDGVFAAEVTDEQAVALLELLPDSMSGRYRVSARMRHDGALRAGRLGVYVGHHTYPNDPRDVHAFTSVRFNGVVGHVGSSVIYPNGSGKPKELVAPNSSEVDLDASLLAGWGGHLDQDYPVAGVEGQSIPARDARSGYWYDIELTVTPDSVSVVLDGDRMVLRSDVVRRAVAPHLAELRKRPSSDPVFGRLAPAFAPRGGVGLYLRRGGIAVRDVTVTPLSDDFVPHYGRLP